MAKTLDMQTNLTGKRVYSPYNPKKAGIVIQDDDSQNVMRLVTVSWVGGTTEEITPLWLNSFDELLVETERKLKTHKKTDKSLDELAIKLKIKTKNNDSSLH